MKEGALPAKRGGRRYTLYTALLAAGAVAAMYLLLGVWPFGDGTTLTGDLNGIYISDFAHLKRALAGQAGWAYGFDKGLGGNLTGLAAYNYSSPLNLLYALVPLRWAPVVAAALMAVKLTLACVFCQIHLQARFAGLGWYGAALGLCYGLSAYSLAYAQHAMWHDVVALLPLVCLGIDRIAAGRGLVPYTLALALAIFCNFYIAYMVCIFAVLYFAYTMLLRPGGAAGWKGPVLRFAGGSLLAAGLNAAFLLPALADVAGSKGSAGGFAFSLAGQFPLYRLPERLLFGAFAIGDVQGYLPFLYCGVPVLVLVVCFFAGRAVGLKEKLFSAAMLLVFVLSFWVKGLDMLWHGMKEPVWFPARYSFIFCFFCVLLAATAVARGAVTLPALAGGGAALVVALGLMAVFPGSVGRGRVLLTLAAVAGYCVILALAPRLPAPKRGWLAGGLAVVVAAELMLNGYYITNKFEKYPLSAYQQFIDESGGTVQAVQRADPSAYRMAESGSRHLNDSMLLGYWGIGHFSSVQDNDALAVLHSLGYRVYGGNGPYLYGNTAFADAALGLRYLVESGGRALPAHWRPAGIEAPLPVHQNPYALPLFFTIEAPAAPGQAYTWQGGPFDGQTALYHALTGTDALWGAAPELLVRPGDAGGTVVTVTAARAGYHYACLHMEGEAPVAVNGVLMEDAYGSAMNSGVLQLGCLQPGESAVLEVDALLLADGAVEARCLPAETLDALVEYARAGAGVFAARDGLVEGRVEAADGRELLYTSIPWDDGWRAEVNGEAVQPVRLGYGLLAVPLAPGENTVRLWYVPPGGGWAGWAATAASLALLVLAALWPAVQHKRRTGKWR